MEVLAVIESIQKHVGRKFSPEEIESGILKDLITNADYDIIRVVRTLNIKCTSLAPECVVLLTLLSSAFKCSISAIMFYRKMS